MLAYRAALAADAPAALLAHWRWRLPYWTAEDRKEFEQTMARARVAQQQLEAQNPQDNRLRESVLPPRR